MLVSYRFWCLYGVCMVSVWCLYGVCMVSVCNILLNDFSIAETQDLKITVG